MTALDPARLQAIAAKTARQRGRATAPSPAPAASPAPPPRRALIRRSLPVGASDIERGDHVELGARLLDVLGSRDELVFDEGHAWRFENTRGLWSPIDRSEESRIVQGFAGIQLADGKALDVSASDVSGSIKLAHDQIAKPGFFAGAPAGVAFADCVVRIGENGIETLPHAAQHRARAGYPFAFARNASPARFTAFLSDLFRDDADRDAKTSLVQEFFGACVLGIAPTYQCACVAVGEGENGKSTLADVVLACMPAGTTSAIPPQEWGQEYRRAMLVGKHLNAVGELPEREIIASEAFKAIVTGDPITGRQIREAPMMFRPKAGHYFAANRLPGTSDQSEGFWRRFVVLTFNRSFKGDPNRDPDIAAKLIAERPAIVAWMLEGAARLVGAKSYTIPSSHHAALDAWRLNADQVALFIDAEMRPLVDSEPMTQGSGAAGLYSIYVEWAKQNGHRPVSSNRFADRMKGIGFPATKTKRGMFYRVTRLSTADRALGVQSGAGEVHPRVHLESGGTLHA